MGTAVGAALIGRSEELGRLRTAFSSLQSGSGGIVLLAGEAGAGKTALLSLFLSEPAVRRKATVAQSAALDYAPAPYGVIRDLLIALDRALPKLRSRHAALFERLAPILEFRTNQSGDAGEQRLLLDTIVEAVARYADAAPLVLTIEDFHWIDRASADALVHISRALPTMRALLILTYRESDAANEDAPRYLAGQLARTGETLLLRPLSPADALLLVDEIVEARVSMKVRHAICQLAEGNPLLLVELSKHVNAHPNAKLTALPASVKAMVAERLADFTRTDVEILRVAAAMDEFDPAVLAQIAAVPVDEVYTTLHKARDASIVGETSSEATPFVFRHALMRMAITDQLLGVEQRSLHGRIAAALAAQPETPKISARLAYHYWMAGDSERAERYNAAAGDEAMSVFAFRDAARYYERAIGTRDVDEENFSLHDRLAQAMHLIGSNESVNVLERMLNFARGNGPAERAARLAYRISLARYYQLDDEGTLVAARSAIELCRGTEDRTLLFELQSVHAWYLIQLRRLDEGAAVLREAEEHLANASPEARMRYHELLAAIDIYTERVADWKQQLEQALAIADAVPPSTAVNRLSNMIALCCSLLVQDEEFIEALYDRACALMKQLDTDEFSHVHVQIAWRRLLRGDLEGARAALERAQKSLPEVPARAFLFAHVGIRVAVRTNDAVLLRRCTQARLLEAAFASNDPIVFGPISAAVAEQLRAEGRTSELHALLAQTIKRIPRAGENFELMIAVAREPIPERARAVELLEKLAPKSPATAAGLLLARAYGASGETRRAMAREAASAFRDIGWRLYEAESLLLAGDSAGARAIYEAGGATGDLARLQPPDEKQNKRETTLSKREWEVASLVGEGLSNRLIAERLILSEKTVENHIASIFNKLGVRSRSEVAAYVARALAGVQ